MDLSSGVIMDSNLSSVVLESKNTYVKYQIKIVFCALYACWHENLPYFAVHSFEWIQADSQVLHSLVYLLAAFGGLQLLG